jgi:predicted metalloprotease with PDZ domain
MVKITEVLSGAKAESAGIKANDLLLKINGNEISDVLDYRFYLAEKKVELELSRNGEVYNVLIKKGQYVDAQRYLDIACSMDPYNREYRSAKEQLHRQANGYGNGYDTPPAVGCSCCDICAGLMCMDCLCSCIGCR